MVTRIFAALALVSALAWLTSLAWVHLVPTGYDPVQNAVSDYGVGKSRAFYRAQTAAAALAAVALALALWRAVAPRPALVIALLAVFAAARLVIPSFPTDLDRGKPTPTGRVHILLAAMAFASIAWAAAALPSRVDWPGLDAWLKMLRWVVVGTAIASGLCMTRALHAVTEPFFGLVERCFYVAMLAWFFTVSIHLL